MTFGQRDRELRHAKEWSLRDLAQKVDVGFTYLSRVEKERLNLVTTHRLFNPPPCRRIGSRRGRVTDLGQASS